MSEAPFTARGYRSRVPLKHPVPLAAGTLLAALLWLSPAFGGELQWRKPSVARSAGAAAESQAGKTSASGQRADVRRVAHQEDERIEGPSLVPASGEAEEPRKLRSVLVRSSVSPRATGRAEVREKELRPLALPDRNVLRASANERGKSPAGRVVEQDPFEQTAEWTSRDGGARAASPLRLAQNETEDESTRSVLVRDPFDEGAPTTDRDASTTWGDRFASQPMPPDGAEASQPLDEEEPGLGFRRYSEEPFGAYGQDRSLEALRQEAEATCKEALEVLRRDRISTIDLGIDVSGEPGEDYPFECSLDTSEYEPRAWSDITFMWKASALCHKPLYFENVALERYGHSWGWHVQPLVSAAHFFTTVPILPYKMGLTPPNECIYALGYYRPGNCAPYLIEPLGTHPRAVVWQAGAVVGAAAIVP